MSESLSTLGIMDGTRLGLRLAASVALISVFACGGDSGTDVPVPTTIVISGGPVALTEIGQTATIGASVLDQDGETIPGASVTFSSDATSVATVSSGGVVTARGNGSAEVTASSGTASSTVDVTVTLSTLELGEPIGNLSGGGNFSERYFTVSVPAGTGVLEVRTEGGLGDPDIVVRFGNQPEPSAFDCASVLDSTAEICSMTNPQPGTWHILLLGSEAYSGVTLRARSRPLTPIQDGVPITGLSAALDEFLYFDFEVPASGSAGSSSRVRAEHESRVVFGVKPDGGESLMDIRNRLRSTDTDGGPDSAERQAGEATLIASTAGGTGDVDLIGDNSGAFTFTPAVESPCASLVDGNTEQCVITSPAVGEWQFVLWGYRAFTGVTFEVEHTPGEPAPDPGTITIQKTVQSSGGGTPDNPVNPPLSGFEFEVVTSGSTSVVETVTTDASGQAVATVPPGTYDIVESDSQGLTDFTGAANGVTVTEGGNVNVGWINRQLPPGNQNPVAIINASPGSLPQGDGNSTTVTLYAGNSSDPNGDPLGFTWVAQNGTFIGGTSATSTTAKVTFPGTAGYAVTLTVTDGEGGQDVAQTTIELDGALPPAGTFDIELVNLATPSAAVQNALNLAVATWESIIRNEVSNINFGIQSFPADRCIEGQPEITDVVDDLRIYVDIAPIDGAGSILGQAGACAFRNADSIPVIGQMQFDSDDLAGLSSDALNRVILHEMGHVLGIGGGLWTSKGLLENPSCPDDACSGDDPPGPDTRFTGTDGVTAWRSLGGPNDEAVPVENGEGTSAGPGARDSHWREIVFGNELMTGFLNGGVTNPLSQLTLASLVDLGYRVDFSQADPYTVPNLLAAPLATPERWIDLRNDVRVGPIHGVDDDGRIVWTIRPGG